MVAGPYWVFLFLASFAFGSPQILSSLDCYKQGCSSVVLSGDTYIFTAWGPTGNTVYNGLSIPGISYGTFNDGASIPCTAIANNGGNISVIRLNRLDLNDPKQTIITQVNCMKSFGGAGNPTWDPAPRGQCNAAYNNNCTWKSSGITSVDGNLYLQVIRQEGGPYFYGHDSTLIMSKDGGASWINPARVGLTPDPLGDAPKGPGDQSYEIGVLWPEPIHQAPYYDGKDQPMYRLSFIQYCQDESIDCPAADDNKTYVYALAVSGNFSDYYLTRIKKTNLPRLLASDWEYYYCPGYSSSTVCDGTLASSWTKNIFEITSIQKTSELGGIGQAAYLKNSGHYIFITSGHGAWDIIVSTANHPWGPWVPTKSIPRETHENGFPGPMLFTSSENKIVMVSDATDNPPNSHAGTIFFDLIGLFDNKQDSLIQAYPNPRRKGNITFSGLKDGSTIDILSVSGDTVKKLQAIEHKAIWDIQKDKVPAGIYTYVVDGKIGGMVAVIWE